MSGGLWHDHPATPRQQQLVCEPARRLHTRRRGRPTQADVLVGLLRQARDQGRPLGLPEIMAAGIAQHGARFAELRARGFAIVNRMDRAPDGRVLSRYSLEHDPERERAV